MGKDRSDRPAAEPDRLIGVETRDGEQQAGAELRDPARRGLYGRSRGKTLRSHHAALVQNLLPTLEIGGGAIGDCAALFPFSPVEVWLEIGFGGGEHLIAQAQARRDVGFIGCEPFRNGVAKALAGVEAEKLDNVRLREGDAAALLAGLPAGALSRVFILYPDPWPKRRQNKRRLISPAMVDTLARTMRPGATIRFATDIDDYAGWTLRRFLDSAQFAWLAADASDWREPWADWRPTRYEAKARREGRSSVYLTFTRV